jgi:hypothetical protein
MTKVVTLLPVARASSPHLSKLLAELGELFPSLSGMPGVHPWMPKLLDHFLQQVPPSERHAGLLLLSIWQPGTRWASGQFDVVCALRDWSPADREAFVSYVKRPFFASQA